MDQKRSPLSFLVVICHFIVPVFAAPFPIDKDQLPCRSSIVRDTLFPSEGETAPLQDLFVLNHLHNGVAQIHGETPCNSFPGVVPQLCDYAPGSSSNVEPSEHNTSTPRPSHVLEALRNIERVLMSEDMDPVAFRPSLPCHMPLMTSISKKRSLNYWPWDLSPLIPSDEPGHHWAERQLVLADRTQLSHKLAGDICFQDESTFGDFRAPLHNLYPFGHHYNCDSCPGTSFMKPSQNLCAHSDVFLNGEEIIKNGQRRVESCGTDRIDGSVDFNSRTYLESTIASSDFLWPPLSLGCPPSPISAASPALIPALGLREAEPCKYQIS